MEWKLPEGVIFSVKPSSTNFKWLSGLSCSFQAHGPLYLGRAGGMATCRFIVLQSKELWEVFPGKGHELCVALAKEYQSEEECVEPESPCL